MSFEELQRQEEQAYAQVRFLESELEAAMDRWGAIWAQIRERVEVSEVN